MIYTSHESLKLSWDFLLFKKGLFQIKKIIFLALIIILFSIIVVGFYINSNTKTERVEKILQSGDVLKTNTIDDLVKDKLFLNSLLIYGNYGPNDTEISGEQKIKYIKLSDDCAIFMVEPTTETGEPWPYYYFVSKENDIWNKELFKNSDGHRDFGSECEYDPNFKVLHYRRANPYGYESNKFFKFENNNLSIISEYESYTPEFPDESGEQLYRRINSIEYSVNEFDRLFNEEYSKYNFSDFENEV